MSDYGERVRVWLAERDLWSGFGDDLAALLREVAEERLAQARAAESLGAGPVYLSLRDVPEDQWPDGGLVSCAALAELREERRVTAKERNEWVSANVRLEAERDELRLRLDRLRLRAEEARQLLSEGRTSACLTALDALFAADVVEKRPRREPRRRKARR